jgi:hypothetical protein
MNQRLFSLATVIAALSSSSGVSLHAGHFANISIDGVTGDWAGVPVAHSDPNDSASGTVDWKDIYIANDDDYLYVRVTLWTPADASSFVANYYVDGDNVDSTGYHVFGGPNFGSSLLMQSGAGYQQAGGGFNEGGLAGSATSFAPLFAGPGLDFEYRIDRDVVGVAGTFSGQPLIASGTVQVQLQTDGGDLAPDANNGLEYTFAAVPEPASLLIGLLGSCLLLAQRHR